MFLNANILSRDGSRNKRFAPLSSFHDSILSAVEVIQISAGVLLLSSCCSAALNCAAWLKPTRMEPFITPGAMHDLWTREHPGWLVCGFICQPAERRRGHKHKWDFERSLLWHHRSCCEHLVSCRRATEGPKRQDKQSKWRDSEAVCVAAQILYTVTKYLWQHFSPQTTVFTPQILYIYKMYLSHFFKPAILFYSMVHQRAKCRETFCRRSLQTFRWTVIALTSRSKFHQRCVLDAEVKV